MYLKKGKVFLLVSLLIFILVGCGGKEDTITNIKTKETKKEETKQTKQTVAEKQVATPEKKELLIYCGVTMMRPMEEIAKVIEAKENCVINFKSGGSGALLKVIQTDKTGDLFLPGSDSYIKTLEESGDIDSKVQVGYNKACMLVQKGNPLNITADLENFTMAEFEVVIGNPDSGSIGKETKKILDKKGIYDDVVNNASKLTNDSTELLRVIKDKEADLVINWYAVSQWDENVQDVDVLEISEEFAAKKNLVIGLLKYSENKDIAQAFIDFAASSEGQEIFNKYGLYDVK